MGEGGYVSVNAFSSLSNTFIPHSIHRYGIILSGNIAVHREYLEDKGNAIIDYEITARGGTLCFALR
jgi:hypothetical protein